VNAGIGTGLVLIVALLGLACILLYNIYASVRNIEKDIFTMRTGRPGKELDTI
jgi:hypothetical protein